jgi:hypothetical protein
MRKPTRSERKRLESRGQTFPVGTRVEVLAPFADGWISIGTAIHGIGKTLQFESGKIPPLYKASNEVMVRPA